MDSNKAIIPLFFEGGIYMYITIKLLKTNTGLCLVNQILKYFDTLEFPSDKILEK